MTAFDPARLDRISAEAREIHLGRTVLTAVMTVFWLIGWTGRKLVLALAYVGVAIRVGWQDASPTPEQQRR